MFDSKTAIAYPDPQLALALETPADASRPIISVLSVAVTAAISVRNEPVKQDGVVTNKVYHALTTEGGEDFDCAVASHEITAAENEKQSNGTVAANNIVALHSKYSKVITSHLMLGKSF